MIQITVREFRTNLKKYLAIPCQVTSHGVPIASIIPVGEVKSVGKPYVSPDPNPLGMVKKEVVYIDNPKTFWYLGKKYMIDENGNEKEVK